jgi:hypothetical protein
MSDFQGADKTRSYFEGWYFKHQNGTDTVAFIPGVDYDERGRKSAFVQVITEGTSCCISYPFADFRVCPHGLAVRIGSQFFSDRGIRVDLNAPGFRCKGSLRYGPLTPLRSDVMGPFRHVPFMECSHGVISMKHSLCGALEINGISIDFGGGTGYIEKDWGSSFPKRYLWVQCSRFLEPSCSIMVSIARIPFCGCVFTGCIAVVCFRGREYRLATYSGVKVLRWDESGFLLRQGDCMLEADVLKTPGQRLSAPQNGAMRREIRESASCPARFRFYRCGRLLFDLQSDDAGFEYVE